MCDAPISADEAARWVVACARDRLADRKIVCVKIAGVGLLVIQDGDRIYACERACPHEQADLGLGRVADGQLYCPRHFAWFSLTEGHISPGWPSRPLLRYPVRVAEGQVWIDARALTAK